MTEQTVAYDYEMGDPMAPNFRPDIQLFHYNKSTIRIFVNCNSPWFCSFDVCGALQIKNSRKAIISLDRDEKCTVTISDTANGHALSFVSEPGLYKLIMRSRKPEARAFQRWVTHEVLPSIRRTGSYQAPGSTEAVETAAKYLDQRARMREALIRWELRLIMDRRGVTPDEVARLAAEAAAVQGTYAGFDWQRWNVGTPSQASLEAVSRQIRDITEMVGDTPPLLEEHSTPS